MRVTVAVDNVIFLDGNDVAEIAAFVKALRNVVSAKPKPEREPESEPGSEEEVSLSAAQLETWQWLVRNDTVIGRTAAEAAEALGITLGAAHTRMSTLVKNGVAHRVTRGQYRPGEN